MQNHVSVLCTALRERVHDGRAVENEECGERMRTACRGTSVAVRLANCHTEMGRGSAFGGEWFLLVV